MQSAEEIRARIAAAKAARELKDAQQRAIQATPEPEESNQPELVSATEQDFNPGMWAAYADAVPQVDGYERPDYEVQIDKVINEVDIVEAYRIWCGKMSPKTGGKTESIMISCPMPDHQDRNPSAWMNSDKGTWYCGACEEGGDKFDLAAIKMGFDRSTYKDGQNFGELRRAMAKDLGLQIDYVPGVGYTVWTPISAAAVQQQFAQAAEPEAKAPKQEEAGAEDSAEEQPALPVSVPTQLVGQHFYEEDKDTPFLNWRDICPENTFLRSYMEACTIDDVPEEFHFWYAMMGLGLVNGRNVFMMDAPPVFGNLFVVMLGRTGSGKSRSRKYLFSVLRETVGSSGGGSGVKFIASPGSAEALIDQFDDPIFDPTQPKARIVIGRNEVRGLVDFGEFKELTSKMRRQGSSLEPTLMQFYDSDDEVTTVSRGAGEARAENPHLSLLSTTQPESLQELFDLGNEDSGFLNRFLFVGGPRKEAMMFPPSFPDMTLPIRDMREIVKWGKTKRVVQLTPTAKSMLTEIRKNEMETDMSSLGNAFARIALVVKKLCLIFAINDRSEVIDETHVLRAMKLYPYIKKFVEIRVKRMVSVKSLNGIEDLVLETLAKKFPVPPANQLHLMGATASQIKTKVPKKLNLSTSEINKACLELERGGTLEELAQAKNPNGGRPAKKYWFKDVEVYRAYLAS